MSSSDTDAPHDARADTGTRARPGRRREADAAPSQPGVFCRTVRHARDAADRCSGRASLCCRCTPPAAARWKRLFAICFLPATPSSFAPTGDLVKCGARSPNRSASSFTAWRRNGIRDIDPAEVDRVLQAHPAIRAVAMAYSDTSTGVANDVAGVARVARVRGVLTLVDGVSSIGGMPFAFDDWGVDAAITASQKCLMSSPGLSFVVLSSRARDGGRRCPASPPLLGPGRDRTRRHENEAGNARHAAGPHHHAGGRGAADDS